MKTLFAVLLGVVLLGSVGCKKKSPPPATPVAQPETNPPAAAVMQAGPAAIQPAQSRPAPPAPAAPPPKKLPMVP